jgi:hypothetical protein
MPSRPEVNALKPLMSVPEMNALPPTPRKVTTRTPGSFAMCLHASRKSHHISCVRALYAERLSNRIRATAPTLS